MTATGSDHSSPQDTLPAQVCDYGELFARIRSGHILVTGNSRLSRYIKHRYNHWRMDQGDENWPSPVIVPWARWLDDLWELAVLHGVEGAACAVPGPRQILSLWQYALQYARVQHDVLRPESLARELRDARALAVEWRIDLRHPAWFDGHSENHAAFHQWNRFFEQHCRKEGWLPPEDRLSLLAQAIRDSGFRPPGPIDMLGFDELTPARGELLHAMADSGIALCQLRIEPRAGKTGLLKCVDADDELERAARWARYWYEREPASEIAIVVPDLQARRGEVERRLRNILDPGRQPGSQVGVWNISMGIPLSRLPMIETAFDLLGLLERQVDIQQVGRVLRSPWLAGASSECGERALLEKKLRETYSRQLTTGSIRYRAGELHTRDANGDLLPEAQWRPQPWNCPELLGVMEKIERFGRDTGHARHQPSWWAKAVDQLLTGLGWPLADIPEHDGADWQALQAWRDTLRDLASLDATTQTMGRQQAIGELRQICHGHIFQPQTPPARIQVLGLYEAHSLQFDYLWVVGLHAGNWPADARPNPFIPYKLQTMVRLPNCNPQRELDVAQSITVRLINASPDCIFSYPGQADGEDVLPSPLLAGLDAVTPGQVPCWNNPDWRTGVASAEGPRLEALSMPGALKYGVVTGGSSILRHQALCPFRAFASNRLGAEALEVPHNGVSPALHGSLVHSVFEAFWKEVRNQAALLQMTPDALDEVVARHVEAITEDESSLKHQAGLRRVEADRIRRHVSAFLLLEKEREPFEVRGFEQWVTTEIAGQTINLRVDRLDTLEGGEVVIIDYKTGEVKPAHWFGERPEDPQLPLYAVSAGEVPVAVVFAIVREAGHGYKGVVLREGLLPGLPPKKTSHSSQLVEAGENMAQTVTVWRQVLQQLMCEFLDGEANIDPKSGTATCANSYCEMHALCRVHELAIDMESGLRGGAS